jgi:hypothetical protein
LISSLVDATVESLDDAVLLAANWVLELLDDVDSLKDSTKVTITADRIPSFQNTVGKPFVADLHNKPIFFHCCCVSIVYM